MKQNRKRDLRWPSPKAHTHSIKSIRMVKSHPLDVHAPGARRVLTWLSISIVMHVDDAAILSSSGKKRSNSVLFSNNRHNPSNKNQNANYDSKHRIYYEKPRHVYFHNCCK